MQKDKRKRGEKRGREKRERPVLEPGALEGFAGAVVGGAVVVRVKWNTHTARESTKITPSKKSA